MEEESNFINKLEPDKPLTAMQKKIIDTAVAISLESAVEAGSLGFMARTLIQATLPHSKIDGISFQRKNGDLTLSIMSDSSLGLPYGCYPRLILAWLATEAVRTKSREIILGKSLSNFMKQIDIIPSGGRWGTVPRFRDQLKRLFSSIISCTYSKEDNQFSKKIINIADETKLWWDPKKPDKLNLFDSFVILGQSFFDEITTNPVPVDIRAISALKNSAFALDLYFWLTHRISYVSENTTIPFSLLQLQFGAGYKDTKQGRFEFKRTFYKQLSKVKTVYPDLNITEGDNAIIISPSNTHVRTKSGLRESILR